VLSSPFKSALASNVSKDIDGCVHLATLLGNDSIVSRTARSGLCHGLPGKVRENRRVVDEPRLNRRLCQYPLPSIHLPHHASNNDDYGNGCWGPRHLNLQDYEYRRSGGSFLLGLYKPDLIVCRAHVQVLPSISSPTLRAIPPTAVADPNQT